jgi:hypothetical protein
MAVATCLGSAALALNQVKAIAEQLMAEAGGCHGVGAASATGCALQNACSNICDFVVDAQPSPSRSALFQS